MLQKIVIVGASSGIGRALAFEVASVLLLAAMVGSIMVARDRK